MCPCGSGKKYKRCHGTGSANQPPPTADAAMQHVAQISLMRHEARRKEMEAQFGLGRPPISLELNGYRLVAVGPELHWSKSWNTFPDFLMDYFKKVMGSEWGEAQIGKPRDQRHPLFTWYSMVCEYQKTIITTPGQPTEAALTGAACGIMWLTYGLYLLRHNVEIQLRLLQRLRATDPVQIFGALHEALIAAAMIRAGFALDLENETDGSQTHCEFTATSKFTGKQFSVEVKVCNPGAADENDGRRVLRQLSRALSKAAKHERIVCIDLNQRVSGEDGMQATGQLIKREMQRIRHNEKNLKIHGKPTPPAYVLLSNFPFRYDLKGTSFVRAGLLEGLKVPGLDGKAQFRSPRELSEFRAQNADVIRFCETLLKMQIPSTLDGELPSRAFGGTEPRFLVGESYLVKDRDGHEVAGELLQALVSESEMCVTGLLRINDGSTIICKVPLTETELMVYRESPTTFFGIVEPKKRIEDPGELYEWLLSAYEQTPADRLLELLKGHPDIESLRTLSQLELAKTYANWAASLLAMHRPVAPAGTSVEIPVGLSPINVGGPRI